MHADTKRKKKMPLPMAVAIAALPCLAAVIIIVLAPPLRARAQGRVAVARSGKGQAVKDMVAEAGLSYPPRHVFFRAFKLEGELEVWGRDKDDGQYKLVKTYPICYLPGELGPKRREGDLQVPEGVYKVTVFNPWSSFHLSMGIDYPNRSDRILGHPAEPGGEIYIHGNCVSIGCIPIQDGPIEEVYLMALDSRNKSKIAPAVHIYPCRMDSSACQAALKKTGKAGDPDTAALWSDLAAIHASFEKNNELPSVKINSKGRYAIEE